MKCAILLVSLDLDGEFLRGTQRRLVSERQETNLVQSIRSVRNQLTKKDLEKRENEKREREEGGRGKEKGGGGKRDDVM